MKRPYQNLRVGVVALSICVLTVDPAAACKLLGNRRCCCVCAPAADSSGENKTCTDVVPAKGGVSQAPVEQGHSLPAPPTAALPVPTQPALTQPALTQPALTQPAPVEPPPARPAPAQPLPPQATASQPSPRDLPPATATGGGTLIRSQQPKPNNDQASIAPTQNNAPNAAAAASTTLRLGEPQPPSPADLNRAADHPAVIHEPAFHERNAAPPGLAREPATIDANHSGRVENPAAAPAATASDTLRSLPTPSTFDVAPRSTREPAAAATTTPPTNLQHAATAEPAPQATIKRSNDEPLTTAGPPMPPGGRLPAASAPALPRTAVDAPGFPPASDDPFAPMPPKKPQPIEDDPFAPLPQATKPASPPAGPIAAEPTNAKAADALTLDPDGRLPVRDWSDNSGTFRIKAKLVLILDGKVRLQKETGRTTTVPLARLSERDRTYINEVISRYGKDLTTLDQLAAR